MKHVFLTYNESESAIHIHEGCSISADGLTYEDILEAIERQQWIKKHEIKLCGKDLLEIENLKDYKKRLKEINKDNYIADFIDSVEIKYTKDMRRVFEGFNMDKKEEK